MKILMVGIVLIGLLGATGVAGAQQNKPSPRLRVLIETLSPGAHACGIDQSSLEAMAALTLRNNGIQVAVNSNPYLYINVMSEPAQNIRGNIIGCTANLDISVRWVSTFPEAVGGFRPRNGGAHATLCEAKVLLHNSQTAMGSALTTAIEQHIKLCLGKLDY